MPTTRNVRIQNPPLFGRLLEKARAGGLPPKSRSRSRQRARTYPKKGLRENLGVPRAMGRPKVTRPSSFQDLKEAYETYGRPRVTRRPRRPKRPRVTRWPRRPKRPKLTRPTGGARVMRSRVTRGPRVHLFAKGPVRAVAPEALGLTSIQEVKWGVKGLWRHFSQCFHADHLGLWWGG